MSPVVSTVRGMDVLAILGTAAAGAVIGFIAKVVVESLGRRHQLRTRWDAELLRLSIEFSKTGRYLLNNVESGEASDAEHDRLRAISEQLRLIGNAEVQRTSRSVVHEAYAVRSASTSLSRPTRDAYLLTLDRFYIACRRQLRVPKPADVERQEPGSKHD